MTRKIFASALVIASMLNGVNAQDSTKSLTISGSVDAYYRASGGEGNLNNFTSFTNSNNTFQLGMASVKAAYASGKVGAVLDLGFGTRADEFSYADAGALKLVKQAYITFAPSDKVKFTIGKFATHVGYELVDPQLNKNYSMSYMFTNGPFTHTGVKADFTLGGGSGIMVGVANPIDVTSPSSGAAPKTLIAQYSKVGASYAVYLNYAGYFGAKLQSPSAASFNQVGLTATATVSDKFSLGYDGTVQAVKDIDFEGTGASKTKSWWASALYANVTATDKCGVTLRGEYFADKKYAIKAPGSDIFATTLSANYKVGGLTLIPELRYESAKDAVFTKGKAGDPSKTAFSAILAAVYSF